MRPAPTTADPFSADFLRDHARALPRALSYLPLRATSVVMTGTKSFSETVHIIGAGLAGSEAAWQVARSGIPVTMHEMRPVRMTEAHRTDGLAELVCSNSFRSDDATNNAVGLLHAEMRRLGSLIMSAADANQVPAGGAACQPQPRSFTSAPRAEATMAP